MIVTSMKLHLSDLDAACYQPAAVHALAIGMFMAFYLPGSRIFARRILGARVKFTGGACPKHFVRASASENEFAA